MHTTTRAFGIALLLLSAAASAMAAPCKTPRQLRLMWDASKNESELYAVAYGCALPASCPVEMGTTATKLPLHVSLRAGDTALFQSDVQKCDAKTCLSMNTGGCKGGGDAHKGENGLVKLSYPSKGVASVMMRVHTAMKQPPADVSSPVTLSLTDAAGYSAEAVYEKCRTTHRAANVVVLCR